MQIKHEIDMANWGGVLDSEPVGGRSWAIEFPCCSFDGIDELIINNI